jgi:hydroxymethylpyrimidine pyrophosphatase-like HAD family hydrolase
MSLPIKLISTDFDGTLFAEFENPPIPDVLQRTIADLQSKGARWAINTGRDMSSLMESLGRAGIRIEPDYLVLVEREIYTQKESVYVGLEDWNSQCTRAHTELFTRVREDVPRLVAWVNERFHARMYEDAYSPFCLIAGTNDDADVIHQFLHEYALGIENLTVVRNDVYARFCHSAYNKGTALAELTRRLGFHKEQVFAVGDHLNDLPMLSRKFAHWIAAPANAIEPVKDCVQKEGGYISQLPHGWGVAEAIKYYLGPERV